MKQAHFAKSSQNAVFPGQMAVIFDVDGVLVDSYDAHWQSWMRLAQETGVSVSQAEFAETFGRTSRDIIRRFWNVPSHDDSLIARLDERKESLYRDIVSSDFPAMDGAVEFIAALRRECFLVALGSSGPTENVELAVERLEIRQEIGAVVTGSDVVRGKPDPEVFVLASERLGVSPGRCVVIEDAPAGIEAARSAGMKCIALLSTGRRASDFLATPPDLVVSSLRTITVGLVDQILRNR